MTIEAIRETATHRELSSKKEQFKINLLETRIVRSRISNAFQVWKNTNFIPATVRGMERSVVEDLVLMQGADYSTAMTAEDID
jgi:hypothetical protein